MYVTESDIFMLPADGHACVEALQQTKCVSEREKNSLNFEAFNGVCCICVRLSRR